MINNNYVENVVQTIKKQLEQSINDDYTTYKNKCLEDLNTTLEYKRNSVVRDILNGIDISIISNEPYELEPTILIKVEKKIVIKEK